LFYNQWNVALEVRVHSLRHIEVGAQETVDQRNH